MTKVAASANKNWLLVKFRKWHSWGGMFLSVFILLVAVTGILLNHKDLIFHKGRNEKMPQGLLRSTTDFASVPVSFANALELARTHYGDVPLEKIELKDQHGKLIYKVAKGDGEEIVIDAKTGEMTSKYGMRLTAGGNNSLNWAKIVDDLHTGKIFGSVGKLTIDATSGVIILLTLSGIYLWGVPLLRKRKSGKNRSEASAVADSPRHTPFDVSETAKTLPTTTSESDHDPAAQRKLRTKEILEAARKKRELEPQLK
jgi:uncharacterized iron-regulated membrane protein